VALFKLLPIDLSNSCWEASSHRGSAVVRARDEAAARKVAERAFGVKTRFPPGHGTLPPPWLRPELVRVEEIDDPRWSSDGPDEVLDPTFG
jgi:hypothetical protein